MCLQCCGTGWNSMGYDGTRRDSMQARIQGVGAGARAHPWGGVSPFKMRYSKAFEHHFITGRPPLGEILYPPLVWDEMGWGGMGWDGMGRDGRDVTEVERHGTVQFRYPLPEWHPNSVGVKLCGAVKHIRAFLLLPSIDAVSSPWCARSPRRRAMRYSITLQASTTTAI